MIKLCIFDLDGLLIDSERSMWKPNERRAIQAVGYPVDEDLLIEVMGTTNETSKVMFKDFYGPDFPVEKMFEYLLAYNEEQIETIGIPLRPGAMELLNYLKKIGMPCTIGTSSTTEYAQTILDKHGITDYFEHRTHGNEVANGKPAPDIYLKAMSYYDYKPEEICIFEDAHNGALAALATGCKLVLVPDLSRLTDDDLNSAYAVLNKLDDFIQVLENEATSSI